MAETGRKVRCAIYTRKSTEEGLDQAFNSLDAQREACGAYITSQRHEGWTLVKEAYDDGGFSGGNMDRPALKRLLADVEAGKVDVIVVYKVDRLTRSLSDFAKIVEILDNRNASFVSVTQSFNTTTSMGRLTLNVLLSFAQFEREVTGERIRDKISASKQKGIWMGGPVPLGYDVRDRKLVVNEADAAIVRHVFTRYVALGSGQKLIEELRADGYRTRVRPQRNGVIGGVPFGRGMLFHLLSNRIYVGEIVHKGVAHPGEHQPIVDLGLWEAAQTIIAANRVERRTRSNAAHASLLAGIIHDAHGRRMSPSHAMKSGKRYRYYITHASELRDGEPPAARVPAYDLETLVVERIRAMLLDKRGIHDVARDHATDATSIADAIARASRSAEHLDTPYGKRGIVTALVSQVQLHDDRITIAIDRAALLRRLGIAIKQCDASVQLVAPAVKMRTGKETKLILNGDADASLGRDDQLVVLLAEASRVLDTLLSEPHPTIVDLARGTGQCRKRLTRLVRIAWLAPDIVKAILDGRQPASLTVRKLMTLELPAEWAAQRSVLGFG